VSIERIRRHEQIVDLLTARKRVSIDDLVEHFGTSEATVRRDIRDLADHAAVRRIRGGLELADPKTEPSISNRLSANHENKLRIGKVAAELVRDDETIFTGSGSTTLAVAQHLVDRTNLTVISNSLPVLELLANSTGVEVVATGGFLRKKERSFIGHLVEGALAELRADKVLIGIQGIDLENGMTNDFLPETMVDRAIIHFASELIVVADSSKFGRIRPSFVAGIERASVIVTDAEVSTTYHAALADLGVKLIVAADDGR